MVRRLPTKFVLLLSFLVGSSALNAPGEGVRPNVSFVKKTCARFIIAMSDAMGLRNLKADLEIARRVYSSPPYVRENLFGTTFYYYSLSDPHPRVPQVRTNTKGIIIALGGAGGEGTAATFIRNASSMSRYGIDLVAFDYPFHGNGPTSNKYRVAEHFLKNVENIIAYYQSAGVPVGLIGHSFGSTLIQELTARNPNVASFGIMLSPGGNQNPYMLQHYQNFRHGPAWAKFIEEADFHENIPGEVWEEGHDAHGGVSGQFRTTMDLSPIRNEMPIWILAGDDDPWSNRELLEQTASRFQGATVEIVPHVKHQEIFKVESKVLPKETLVTEKLVAAMEQATGQRLESQNNKPGDLARFRFFYQESSLFRLWCSSRGIARPEVRTTESKASEILSDWRKYIVEQHLIRPTTKMLPSELEPIFRNWAGGNFAPTAQIAVNYSINGIPLAHFPDSQKQTVGGYLTKIGDILKKPYAKLSQQDVDQLFKFLLTVEFGTRLYIDPSSLPAYGHLPTLIEMNLDNLPVVPRRP